MDSMFYFTFGSYYPRKHWRDRWVDSLGTVTKIKIPASDGK
jgi:hypothetical protein